MEQLFDLVQFALTIGLLSTVVILPFSYFSTREIRWSREDLTAAAVMSASVGQPRIDGIRRWIARIARRKEAPDEDTNGLSPR